MKTLYACAAVAALIIPSFAQAGGLLEPVGEPEPIAPVVVEPAGGSLGGLGALGIGAAALGAVALVAVLADDDDDDDDDDDTDTDSETE